MMMTYGLTGLAFLVTVTAHSTWTTAHAGTNLNNLPACPKNIRLAWNDCFGKFRTSNGGRYLGDFKNNKYEGVGMYVFPNGDVYFGEFKDNTRNGDGVYIKKNGKKFSGTFDDGIMVKQKIFDLPDLIEDYFLEISIKKPKRPGKTEPVK